MRGKEKGENEKGGKGVSLVSGGRHELGMGTADAAERQTALTRLHSSNAMAACQCLQLVPGVCFTRLFVLGLSSSCICPHHNSRGVLHPAKQGVWGTSCISVGFFYVMTKMRLQFAQQLKRVLTTSHITDTLYMPGNCQARGVWLGSGTCTNGLVGVAGTCQVCWGQCHVECVYFVHPCKATIPPAANYPQCVNTAGN